MRRGHGEIIYAYLCMDIYNAYQNSQSLSHISKVGKKNFLLS